MHPADARREPEEEQCAPRNAQPSVQEQQKFEDARSHRLANYTGVVFALILNFASGRSDVATRG
jgi:hypothetical protein